MKNIILSCAIAACATTLGTYSTYAQAPVAPAKKQAAEPKHVQTDFIRVDQDNNHARLQTGTTTYEKDGVKVDLIGAVHIADQAYYEKLNKQFDNYEVLLFELVGGEKLENGKVPDDAAKKKDAMMGFLKMAYSLMEKHLELTSQMEHIDYSKEHFVHADLSMEEFQRLQKEKGESILSFAMKNAKNNGAMKKQPDMKKLLMGIMSGNADLVKLQLVDTLGAGDDQIAAIAGDGSVIIGDRNIKCLDVMKEQIKAGKKNIGIFYGAAHFPDMEVRLRKMGFKKTKHVWNTAWSVDKAKAEGRKQ